MVMASRVIIVNHTSIMGGAEVGLAEWIRFIDRDRIEPMVVLPGPGSLADRLRAAGTEVVFQPLERLRRSRNPLRLFAAGCRLWRGAGSLKRLVQSREFRLIHANSTTAALSAALAARRAAVPWIWHVRDLVPLGFTGRCLYRQADLIVAVSEAVAGHVQRYRTGRDRVKIVSNGVETSRFAVSVDRTALRRRWLPDLAPETLLVGMVANLVPWKRHDLFLDMAEHLVVGSGLRLGFVLVGDDRFKDHPAYGPAIQRRIDNGPLAKCTVLTGFQECMPELMQALDVLVHPAETEPFGRVVVEAMAAGRPVVAVNAGGPSEIILDGQTGFLVKPNDAVGISDAVRQLGQDPLLRRSMGEAGRERAVRCYDVSRLGSELTELYERLMHERDR